VGRGQIGFAGTREKIFSYKKFGVDLGLAKSRSLF
jgi:hypothetical protein